MNRKQFLAKTLLAAGAVAVPGLYTWQVEPFWLEFVRKDMFIKNLPHYWEGKVLMQISDLHVGARFDHHFLTESFKTAAQYSPDVVVYTGDFVHRGTASDLKALAHILDTAVRGRIATLGVLGNHDYGKNWRQNQVADDVVAIAEAAGIKMLLNECADVRGLYFTGLEDLWSSRFRPEILSNIHPERANIVLCHNPDACDLGIWDGYKSWILSGHTHGGQCRIPGLITPLLPVQNRNYISGEIDLGDGRTLYINRALGHSIQARFMVRPEITLFTLTNA